MDPSHDLAPSAAAAQLAQMAVTARTATAKVTAGLITVTHSARQWPPRLALWSSQQSHSILFLMCLSLHIALYSSCALGQWVHWDAELKHRQVKTHFKRPYISILFL